MSKHIATLRWSQDEGDHFSLGRYTRVHEIAFDGGTTVMGSASPDIVREPFSNPVGVDPEEMFVASIASCHMLWFLDFARRAKVEVLSYEDKAEGIMETDAAGRTSITKVTLRPKVEVSGDAGDLDAIHHKAHEACFIANSVKTEITVEPAA
ncbi:OsmC family protein [Mesorhizobium sp. J428]|uniref:OsmC family protein n=1 Tax=Mesorhizobium sp. J428 TaxID=2898440 RepID=UPI002150AA9D|nr:OsmC family protein [Mesorhizobium sp. J428]MCR5858329.1 OsmC family protein [Mesorhizobium sp. J428]